MYATAAQFVAFSSVLQAASSSLAVGRRIVRTSEQNAGLRGGVGTTGSQTRLHTVHSEQKSA